MKSGQSWKAKFLADSINLMQYAKASDVKQSQAASNRLRAKQTLSLLTTNR